MLLTSTKNQNGKIDFVLNAAQRLADSYGLQPLKILVVKDNAVKKTLLPFIKREKVSVEESYYIVFAIWSIISEEKIDAYISDIATARHASPALLREDKKNVIRAVSKLNEEGKKWAAKQADIAVQNLLKAAAQVNVTAFVEEIDIAGFNQVLHLPVQGLQAVGAVSLQVTPARSLSETFVNTVTRKEVLELI
ncbi:Nitroreductase family protein [Filimonas lacunae]|uniref:Nitroreductase family protein n=1 Tax=Filimonas lacunae TaxID=477680 RepID=A0A173MC99_9BACT|nr:nitroreductase family protein [Filimonas lacunae]BAV05130.1 nitroreductase [Filimonas lacunae]SIT34184.1 Nitroreductase family protein [Filimonas lacunae]